MYSPNPASAAVVRCYEAFDPKVHFPTRGVRTSTALSRQLPPNTISCVELQEKAIGAVVICMNCSYFVDARYLNPKKPYAKVCNNLPTNTIVPERLRCRALWVPKVPIISETPQQSTAADHSCTTMEDPPILSAGHSSASPLQNADSNRSRTIKRSCARKPSGHFSTLLNTKGNGASEKKENDTRTRKIAPTRVTNKNPSTNQKNPPTEEPPPTTVRPTRVEAEPTPNISVETLAKSQPLADPKPSPAVAVDKLLSERKRQHETQLEEKQKLHDTELERMKRRRLLDAFEDHTRMAVLSALELQDLEHKREIEQLKLSHQELANEQYNMGLSGGSKLTEELHRKQNAAPTLQIPLPPKLSSASIATVLEEACKAIDPNKRSKSRTNVVSEAVWNIFNGACQEQFIEWSREKIRLSNPYCQPQEIAKVMDMDPGALNLTGYNSLRQGMEEKGQNGKIKRGGGILCPEKAIRDAMYAIEDAASEVIPFKMLDGDVDGWEADYGKWLIYVLDLYQLLEVAKDPLKPRVELATTLDGVQISDNITIVVAGMKVTDPRAIDPRTGEYVSLFQSPSLCIPLKIVVTPDTKATYNEYFANLFLFF
jgi:hypothetical protein